MSPPPSTTIRTLHPADWNQNLVGRLIDLCRVMKWINSHLQERALPIAPKLLSDGGTSHDTVVLGTYLIAPVLLQPHCPPTSAVTPALAGCSSPRSSPSSCNSAATHPELLRHCKICPGPEASCGFPEFTVSSINTPPGHLPTN